MSAFLSDVIDKALPPAVDEVLARILGESVEPAWGDGRHRIYASGRFGGHLTESLLALAGSPKFRGALIVAEAEAERVFHLEQGELVASASNVLFERLGRILYQAEVVTHGDSEKLIEVEETTGAAALLDWLPEDVLAWAIARRVDAVASALPYIRHGHFVLVEGTSNLAGVPALALDPQELAASARALYDAWRHGETDESEAAGRPEDAPDPLPGPLGPGRTRDEEVDDILRRIREADLGFK